MYSLTLIRPRSNSNSTSPIPSRSGTRPIERRALFAMISSLPSTLIRSLPSSSMISCNFVSVKIVIPLRSRIKRRFLDTSASIAGTIRSIISITVTFDPKVMKAWPSSIPTTPPPMITRLSGTSFISRISSLVMTRDDSIPGTLILLTFEPPARMIFFVSSNSEPLTKTFLSFVMVPIPLWTSTP